MASIPQIYRDKIASSIVGTPGVDTSGQTLGQEIAKGGEAVAAPAWDYLEKQQSMKDEASYNRLMFQHKARIDAVAEDIKVRYAGNPDAAGPAMIDAIGKSLNMATQSAGNPRVKLMAGKGDPFMESWGLKSIFQWSSQQNYANMVKDGTDMIDDSSHKLAAMAMDQNLSVQNMQSAMTPEISKLASKVAEYRASKHPELADEMERKGMHSFYKSMIDATLETQPAKALELAQDPQVTKYLPPDEAKRYLSSAEEAVKNFPEKLMERNIQQNLSSHPEVMQRVMSGQMHWAEIDAMQKKGGFDLTPESYRWMKDLALKTHPEVALPERDAVKAKFLTDAFILSHNDLTKLTSKSDQEAVLMSRPVKDLYNFQNEIGDALARGAITPQEAQRYHSWLAVPLVAQTLAKHDPTFFQKISNGVNSFFHPGMPAKVDEFQAATGVVENYLDRHDMEKNYGNKVSFYENYFKAAEEKMKPGTINPKTNAPYTPQDIAHAVVGESVGDLIDTPFGKKSITGYKNNVPTFETTREEDEALAHAKAMQEIQSKK